MKKLADLDFSGKALLIRVDFNVPVDGGRVTSDARIRAALPTIELARSKARQVILMSHRGRPEEGVFDEGSSLQPVADHLAQLLGEKVTLVRDWQKAMPADPLVMLENVRFNTGESTDSEELSQAYADLCDLFVMDAFGTAHRAQASTHGVALKAKDACAGLLLAAEIEALQSVVENPRRPALAIVGGAKVSTKLEVLESLSDRVDQIIVGGGIANTFLAAAGLPVGKSLCETDLIETAKSLMAKCEIPLPTDVVTAKEFSADAEACVKRVEEVAPDDMILDVGPQTAQKFDAMVKSAASILWNGPVGVFEFPAFASGTESLARSIAASSAFSVAGGGDTLAAIEHFGIEDQISYISTGGGAFLEYMEGKKLPAIAALEQRH